MFGITQLKKQLLKIKIQTARMEHVNVVLSFRPSHNLPINVLRDGGRWICIFECDPDPLKCVIAYGDSPEQACQNFDALWNGTNVIIAEADSEEEEEQF